MTAPLAATPFSITDPLPTGTVLLEASAGTGKTWTIAALVTRWVAEGLVTLPEMLIVTFGRAASQELRARVRERLTEVEHDLGEPPPMHERDELVALLLDTTDHEIAVRRRRIRTALTQFDAATIATTHQFCQQVLRSLGVAGTTDASAVLVEDLDDVLVDVVDDLYLRAFGQASDAPFFGRSEALTIARTAVDDIHAQLRPSGADPTSDVGRRVRFAQAVRDEVDVRKRRLQVMHYNDLLTQLAGALEAPDSPARQRMRDRWRVVLVDEFQDTDPIQWQVLDRAFTGHALAMVLIGDPKQAIYAFRGGDVVTYLRAAATAGTAQTLATNHRSDEPVVRALGAFLGGAELGDPRIAVHPVDAAHHGSRLAGMPSGGPVRLRQVLLEDHLGGKATVGGVRHFIADDLARDIAHLLSSSATFEGRPLRARDIAVLAHRGEDLVDAQRALARVGITAVSGGGASVLTSAAAHDWLALLEAMAAPHRSLLTRGAALTDLLGHSATELDQAGEEFDDLLAQRCRDLAGTYSRQGVAAVLEVLTTEGLPERVLRLVGGERTMTDLRHVAEVLHEAAQRDGLGLNALLEWLRAAMAQDAPGTSGARTRRLDSDAAAVQLVTIHGSKGLQYPIVYLPAVANRWISDSPAIPLFHERDAAGELVRCIDVGGPRPENDWDDAVAAHRAEEAGESLRLLYVALTRAQSQVVLWWSPNTTVTNSALHRLAFGRGPGVGQVPDSFRSQRDDDATVRFTAWADQGALVLERADPRTAVGLASHDRVPDLRIADWSRTIDRAWTRTSYTALSTPRDGAAAGAPSQRPGVESEPEFTAREDEPDGVDPGADGVVASSAGEVEFADLPSPMADLPVGATFGSLVHAVLEHADPQATDLRAELLATLEEQLLQWPIDLDRGDLADALVTVCRTPLGPLAGSVTLADIGRSDRLCELDFELPLGGGDLRRDALSASTATLGDLVPLLQAHLHTDDPVLAWGQVLAAAPDLAAQHLRGYLTGSVDVVLRTGGTYLVVDYKTNWLGAPDAPLTAADYRPERLAEAMGHSSYPLQALLYAVVAHRFLRWRLRDYDPQVHLGGVLYLYVRGMCGPDTPSVDGHPCGVFSWRPPVALVLAVSDLLDGDRTATS
ncbi:UvrD-helicase domain-containing protein [Phycicoccus sp.]|uniref:UvrD-helicase domain-containing protein n=1 Tax=Phycicoccus sp. TaxID=1902410 RepID=UPI00345E3ABE